MIKNTDAASSDASHRPDEPVVPGHVGSSSSDGLQEGLLAGPSCERVTAEMDAAIAALPPVEFEYRVSAPVSESSGKSSPLDEGVPMEEDPLLLRNSDAVPVICEGLPTVSSEIPADELVQDQSVSGVADEYILPGDGKDERFVHPGKEPEGVVGGACTQKRKASNSPKEGDTDLVSGIDEDSPVLRPSGKKKPGPVVSDSDISGSDMSEFCFDSTMSGTPGVNRQLLVSEKAGPAMGDDLDKPISISSDDCETVGKPRGRKPKDKNKK